MFTGQRSLKATATQVSGFCLAVLISSLSVAGPSVAKSAAKSAAKTVVLLSDDSYGPIRIGMTAQALQRTGLTSKKSPYVCDLDPGTRWTFYTLRDLKYSTVFVLKSKVVGFTVNEGWRHRNGLASTSTLRDVMTLYGSRATLNDYNEIFENRSVSVEGGPTFVVTGDSVDKSGLSGSLGRTPLCE
jgi:hypothetical protein